MRKPDKVIGTNYLSRWHIIPRNLLFNIYLHKFEGSDDPRALHDHPWWSCSFLLKGSLYELRRAGDLISGRNITRFLPVWRSAKFAHRLILKRGPAWTIFITGPVIREWGFWCNDGWRHWSTMTTPDGKNIDSSSAKHPLE